MEIVKTARLTLRELTENDAPLLLRFMGKESVMYAWEYAFTKEQVLEWIGRNRERYARGEGGYYLAVRHDGVCVGQAALIHGEMAGHDVWELGWIFDDAYWGNGYATEAALGLAHAAFSRPEIDVLWADIRPENARSVAVARRIGMTPAGERFVKLVNGKEMPHDVYRVSRDAFLSAQRDVEQHHQ